METDICDQADAAPNIASDELKVKTNFNPRSRTSIDSAPTASVNNSATLDESPKAKTNDSSKSPPKDDGRSPTKDGKRQPSPLSLDSKISNNGRRGVVDNNSHHSRHDNSHSGRLKRCKHGRVFVKDSSRKKQNSLDVIRPQTRQSPPPLAGTAEQQTQSKVNLQSLHKERNPIDCNNTTQTQSQSQAHIQNSNPSRSYQIPKTQTHNLNNDHPNSAADRTIRRAEPKTSSDSNSKELLSARLSISPASSYSNSSDIYDPEGPVLPISPCDSPPMSPPLSPPLGPDTHKESFNQGDKNDDDMPSSAVQLCNQEKYLRKLNRQERVAEEVKIALKPHYQKRAISKEQYKDVLRRAVPKICHSKDGEINPVKIRALVGAYVKGLKKNKSL